MADRDSILTKLEALMKRTRENGASEAEVESAMAVARKLMDEHNVAMEEVLLRQSRGKAFTVEIKEETARSTTMPRPFEQLLLHLVSEICGVRWYYRPDPKTPDRTTRLTHYVFYGMEQDILVAKLLFLELLVVIRAMASVKVGSGGGGLQARRRAYCEGFSRGLFFKVKKQGQEAKPTTPGTSLVLCKEEALDRYSTDILNIKQVKSKVQKKQNNPSDYNVGWMDGAEYELNPQNKPHVTQKTNHLN